MHEGVPIHGVEEVLETLPGPLRPQNTPHQPQKTHVHTLHTRLHPIFTHSKTIPFSNSKRAFRIVVVPAHQKGVAEWRRWCWYYWLCRSRRQGGGGGGGGGGGAFLPFTLSVFTIVNTNSAFFVTAFTHHWVGQGQWSLLDHVLVAFSGASRHNASQKILKFKPPCNTSTPSTLEWEEKIIYFCTHIYHRDHNERLIRAIYVGARLNQY